MYNSRQKWLLVIILVWQSEFTQYSSKIIRLKYACTVRIQDYEHDNKA